MNYKNARLPIAAAACLVLGFASFSAVAATPVTGGPALENSSAVIQIAQKKKKMTRKQEIDKSVDSGTVPSRYRSSVPKEYQQYVPFAKQ